MRGPPSEDERMSQRPPVVGRHLIDSERTWEESRLRTPSIDGARLRPSLGMPPKNATCIRPASVVADRTHACPCPNRPAATSEAHHFAHAHPRWPPNEDPAAQDAETRQSGAGRWTAS